MEHIIRGQIYVPLQFSIVNGKIVLLFYVLPTCNLAFCFSSDSTQVLYTYVQLKKKLITSSRYDDNLNFSTTILLLTLY